MLTRGVSPRLSTGHLTVGDWPGGRRSGSIPSETARRRPRSPKKREVIGIGSIVAGRPALSRYGVRVPGARAGTRVEGGASIQVFAR